MCSRMLCMLLSFLNAIPSAAGLLLVLPAFWRSCHSYLAARPWSGGRSGRLPAGRTTTKWTCFFWGGQNSPKIALFGNTIQPSPKKPCPSFGNVWCVLTFNMVALVHWEPWGIGMVSGEDSSELVEENGHGRDPGNTGGRNEMPPVGWRDKFRVPSC